MHTCTAHTNSHFLSEGDVDFLPPATHLSPFISQDMTRLPAHGGASPQGLPFPPLPPSYLSLGCSFLLAHTGHLLVRLPYLFSHTVRTTHGVSLRLSQLRLSLLLSPLSLYTRCLPTPSSLSVHRLHTASFLSLVWHSLTHWECILVLCIHHLLHTHSLLSVQNTWAASWNSPGFGISYRVTDTPL